MVKRGVSIHIFSNLGGGPPICFKIEVAIPICFKIEVAIPICFKVEVGHHHFFEGAAGHLNLLAVYKAFNMQYVLNDLYIFIYKYIYISRW